MKNITTRTGKFPVGFYVKQLSWKDDLLLVCKWALENGFSFVDLDEDADKSAKPITKEGYKIGSVDLIGNKLLASQNNKTRKEAIQQAQDYIRAANDGGVELFNICAIPEDPNLERSDNLSRFVDSCHNLIPVFEETNTRLAIEGWPGPGAIASTPESYKTVLTKCNSDRVGINYDPSHLIATGIDPVRFVKEFSNSIIHMHGKDTEISLESQYQFGFRQPPLSQTAPFSGGHWRYTIPGQGEMAWTAALEILVSNGYEGRISIELEDKNFNGSELGEKDGLIAGGAFLSAA